MMAVAGLSAASDIAMVVADGSAGAVGVLAAAATGSGDASLAVAAAAAAAAAIGGSSAGQPQSLRWLWQTVGATCCWALSDIICDACIRPGVTSPADCKAESTADSAVSCKVDDKENIASESIVDAEAKSAARGDLRKRQRPKPRGSQPQQPCAKMLSVQGSAMVAPPRSPSGRPMHLSPLQSVVPGLLILPESGECVDTAASKAIVAADNVGEKLSPEQNALISGLVSMLTVVITVLFLAVQAPASIGVASSPGSKTGWLALVGGCFHFMAYLSTLCAFSSASSTVITPLMQLSAVWMLPFSTCAASLGLAQVIRPVHLLAVVLICAGGFLPAAEGSLSVLTTGRFWRQRAIRYVALGELLICCYNLMLHQATFSSGSSVADEVGPAVGETVRFFLVSRAANGLTSLILFAAVPSLRAHALALRSVSPRFLAIAFVGECLSMIGVCSVTFSYSSFYEPSVVNAVEGGLQQLFNLAFALLSHRTMGWGREVDFLWVKCCSFALVASGLVLSTM